MADDVDQESKTEDPTPRRREEARRQGQVPFSAEMVGSLVLLAGVIGLINIGPAIWAAMYDVFRHDLPRIFHAEFGSAEAADLIARTVMRMLGVLLPFFGVLLAIGIGASVAQVGFQLNTEKLSFNFDKLNPANGLGRLFSFAALFRGLITLAKVIALAAMAYVVLEPRSGVLASLGRHKLESATATAWAVVLKLLVYLVSAVTLVSVADYFYQRRKFEQSLRMTKEELKRELKEEDGDPQVKARVRALQREIAQRKMLAEVPKATVVVTNPTHYAVALRYDPARGDASPIVVARGRGAFAKRIAEMARENRVPVLERPVLARALYGQVKEGQTIPNVLFQAVAEVLVFIYKLRGYGPVGTPV